MSQTQSSKDARLQWAEVGVRGGKWIPAIQVSHSGGLAAISPPKQLCSWIWHKSGSWLW